MLSVEEILEEILSAGRDPSGTGAVIGRFGNKLKAALNADEVRANEIYGKGVKANVAEEFVLNTGKPYLDNSLSGYSAFPELINYFNGGFRSCMMIPIKSGARMFGVVTVLSKTESFFKPGDFAGANFLGGVVAHECESLLEREQNTSLVQYLEASFDNVIPQCIVNKEGGIVRANKRLMSIVELAPEQLEKANMLKLFNFKGKTLADLWKGEPVEASRADNLRIFRMYPKQVNSGLLHVLLYELTELAMMNERERFFDYGPNDVFLMMDDKSRIYWVSNNIGKVFRVEQEYMLDKRLLDIVKSRESLGPLETLTAGMRVSDVEIKLENDMAISARATIFRNGDGFSVVLSKNNERYLNTIRRNLDETLRLSGDMIITVDSLGYVRGVNRSVEKILKFKGGELSGLSVGAMCADSESQMRMSSGLNMAKSSGIVTDIFVRFSAKGGSEIVPSQQSIRALYDDTNKVSGYMLVGRELATAQRLEKVEEEARKNEREMNRYRDESERKTDFINSISHDLKTPITSISGFAKLLMEGHEFGELNEEQKSTLRIIIDESKRLTDLIEKILDVAKLEANKIKLDLQQVNMDALKENAGIMSMKEVAVNKGLEFNFRVEYDVPEIQADPNRLIQVFVNLLGNATKFTERGSITVHVTRNGKKSKQIRVGIKDTGIGISKEDKAKLFKKFFQINKEEQRRGGGSGTGLGLTIAKEIVRLHGGKIGIESEGPGKGSEFWFTLPITQVQKKKKAVQQEPKTEEKG